MDAVLPNPTFDQLQVFVAVAENGSFSAAARQLNRAQSVISYTIANLEAQLQLVLFDRQSRHPVLTEAGRAVLVDARKILGDLDGLRARSKALNDGLEGELKIAVSVMVPDFSLMQVLKRFQVTFPTVPLQLAVGSPFFVGRQTAEGAVDIGLGGSNKDGHAGLVEHRLGHSYIVPVAAPDHRLAGLGRVLTLADVQDEIQIVVSDTAGPSDSKGFNVISRRIWRVGDMGTKRQLIVGGMGWGGVPLSMIHDDLRLGRLVRLDVEPYEHFEYPLAALWRAASPPGPAGRWLIAQLEDHVSSCPVTLTDALETVEQAKRPVPRSA